MEEGSSRHPSKLLLNLFQEAWKELRVERDEADLITTIEIETRDGEKKIVNGFEFWQQMIEEVEIQQDDPDYLFYSSIDEEKLEDLFTTTFEPQSGEKPSFYMNGKYYIPRIPNLYVQNLNLGYDQWFIAQDSTPNTKIIKIVRRKRYVSPSSTDDEIVLELIYAKDISETMEKDNSEIIKMDANQADELEKQLQTLESGHIYMEDLIEMEDPKETEQMSHKGKFESRSIIDLTADVEEDDEVSEDTEQTSEQKEFETSYFYDLDSCLEDVGAVPIQTEQLSHERESEASYSIDLDEDSDVASDNATHVQVAPSPYQDTVWKDLRSNIATQNLNPQNLDNTMNYPNVVTSPHIPLNNYRRAPFYMQPGGFRKPVHPYKFFNPYYEQGHRHLLRNPFPLRPQLPFIPQPTHRQPRLFPQHPFAPIQSLPPPHMVPRALLRYLSRAHTPLLPRMSPRLLFPYIPLIPTPPLAHPRTYNQRILNSGLPPPAQQTQRISYGDSAERNQQSEPYPSINPRRTQIAPDIPPNGDVLHFINAEPASQSNISTTLDSRENVVQDITTESPWEYIVVIKKKSGQTQLIARAPLSSIIPLPDDAIEDGNQDNIQSGKSVLFEYPPITAKPKKSALRPPNVKRNQGTRRVHFPRSVIEKDEMENESGQSENTNQKSNEDISNDQPEASFDEREYLQTPSIFEILNSRKDADPNEPQKDPTNYMEDVIQRKERRWKSMDQVPGSPSLDLMLDMIKKDNEMLEEEERLQREQKAEQIVSPSTARNIDYEKFESMHNDELMEMYSYEAYEGAENLVENAPEITLELPEITKVLEQQSPKEITASNPSDADVISNINPDDTTVLELAFQEPESPEEITVLNPPDPVDILNLSPVTVLEHALQDFSGFEGIDLDEKNEELQLAVHIYPSNLREFNNVLYKSDEKVSLSACDEIQQKVETTHVLPSADIEAIQDDPLKSQPLQTGTSIHMIEQLKIEIDEEEMALLNNLTTSSERFSLGVLLPDSTVLKLKDKLCDKWSKMYKSVDDVSKENLAAISPDQTLVKKLETSSFLFSKKSQTSTNESHTEANKSWWETNKRDKSVSLENLGDNLNQASIKKLEKSSSIQTISNEIHTQDKKNWWKTNKSETIDLGATSRLDQTPIIKPEKSSSLLSEKSQTIGNESLPPAIKNWWKTKKPEQSVSLENLGATSSLDQTAAEKLEKSSSFSPEKSQISSDNDPPQVDKYWWKTTKHEQSVSLENLGATSSLDQTSTEKLKKSSTFSPERSQISSDNDPVQVDKYWWKTTNRESSLQNLGGNLDQPIYKIMRTYEESFSELVTDKNKPCQLVLVRDQATQTIDTEDTAKNSAVAVDKKDESSQTDEQFQNTLSYAAVVRKNK